MVCLMPKTPETPPPNPKHLQTPPPSPKHLQTPPPSPKHLHPAQNTSIKTIRNFQNSTLLDFSRQTIINFQNSTFLDISRHNSTFLDISRHTRLFSTFLDINRRVANTRKMWKSLLGGPFLINNSRENRVRYGGICEIFWG